MPEILVSESVYRKLVRLKGDMSWDEFMESLLDPNKKLEILRNLLDSDIERLKSWRN